MEMQVPSNSLCTLFLRNIKAKKNLEMSICLMRRNFVLLSEEIIFFHIPLGRKVMIVDNGAPVSLFGLDWIK